MAKRKDLVKCSVLSEIGAAPDRVLLFRAGENNAQWDGDDAPTAFYVDDDSAQSIIDDFRQRGRDMMIDYEHQSASAGKKSGPVPAAGWITALEWVPGVGLYADTKWTDQAASLIESKQYRYLSPEFFSNRDTKRITTISAIALVNRPALNHPMPLAASANAHGIPSEIVDALGLEQDASLDECLATLTEIRAMAGKNEPAKIEMSAAFLKALNLSEDADANTVENRVVALASSTAAVIKALDLAPDADANKAVARVAELKAASSAQPDPAKFTPNEEVAKLSEAVKKLESENVGIRCAAFIEKGMKAGKIAASTREMWERNFKASAEQAEKDLEATPVIVPANGERMTSSNNPPPSDRTAIIASASAEWRNESRLHNVCTSSAWVDQKLRESNMSALTSDEKAKL